ncbi:MAG: hypothetical protein F4Y94_00370 [Chloroflexi bacterium]|nr:hypothetical protein [Chloroflexota bacterium]
MPETTVYTLTGQADLVGTIRRLTEEFRREHFNPLRRMPATLLVGQMARASRSPIGSLMRALHAVGRLDGFKVRRS